MPRTVNAAARAAALAIALVLPAPRAAAQVQSALAEQAGAPAGMALPAGGAAAAEEPSALGVNPAGVGFVRYPALQYFHEEGVTEGSRADGIFAANALGPLGVGFSMEWLRPGELAGPRYRRTSLALSLGDGKTGAIAIAWRWFSSPDAALEALSSWDLGLALRPTRWLSVGAAALGYGARLGADVQPVRYDVGLATRLLDDGLTLSADLLASDRARDDFHPTHVAFGAGLELRAGIAASVQVQVPIRREPGVSGDTSTLLALTWNRPHQGVTAGAATLPGRTAWLAGVRASSERYRAPGGGDVAPILDLPRILSPPRTLFLALSDPDPYATLLGRLGQARDDPDVAAVALEIDDLPVGTGRVEELRAAIAAIRARKPVLAYLTGGGQKEYYLATAAGTIAVPPSANVFVNGVSTSTLFVKEGLARLGVAFEVVKAGAFKSAAEPLTRTEASPEAREAANALLDDVFDREVAAIAEARRLAPERVRALVDQGVFGAEEARAAGLVDAVLWPDELEAWARRESGRRVAVSRRWSADPGRAAQRWGARPGVALVKIEGTIASGASRRDPTGLDGIAGADTLCEQIRRAADDSTVRALLVRIDSPGGDALASDLVWRELARARRKGKPVVASMGDVAASGGYLVAAAADVIVAEPATITGSIGVFALKPDLSGLLGKLSVRREALARGERAQLLSLAKPWTAAERKSVEDRIRAFYGIFLDRVAEGRKLPRAEVEALAGGRVWTGKQAHDRRLVDRLGSFEDALAIVRERIGVAPDEPLELRRASGGASGLPGLAAEALAGVAAAVAPQPALLRAAWDALPEVRAAALLAEMGPVLALPLPWAEPPPR